MRSCLLRRILGQFLQLRQGLAAIDQLRRQFPTFRQRAAFFGHEQRGGTVQENGVTLRTALLPAQQAPDNFRVRRPIAALQVR